MRIYSTDKGDLYFFLEDFINKNNLSTEDLMEAIGVRYNQARNIINGNIESIKFETLIKLCELFNCQPGQLFQFNCKTTSNFKSLNQMNNYTTFVDIDKEYIDATIHIIYYYDKEGILIYGSPELDFFNQKEEIISNTDKTKVINLFLKDFGIFKKERFTNVDDFIIRMQQKNHWFIDDKTNNLRPPNLDYYLENFNFLNVAFNKYNLNTIKLNIKIELNKNNIDLL